MGVIEHAILPQQFFAQGGLFAVCGNSEEAV
jgi:hypothetical protein